MTDTGRLCGTSASSAPSSTAIWTPSASARSTTVRLNALQRNAGSGPDSRIRSRGARGMRTAWTSNSGQSIVRVTPSSSRTIGRVVWKSTNSSGSMLANDSAPRLPATNANAEVADSPASFQPLKAHTSAGARSPSGRRSQRSGCMSSRYRVSIGAITTIASLRAGDPVDAVFACSRKDRLTARSGSPYLALEFRDKTGTIAGRAFRDADVLSGRFEQRRPRARGRPRRALPRRAPARGPRRHQGRDRPTPPRSSRSPTATSTSSTGSSSTWRARSTIPPIARFLDRLLGDAALRAAWRRAPCSRGGPPRLPRRVAGTHRRGRHAGAGGLPAAPASQFGPADHRRARPRPRQDARVHLRRRDRVVRRGPAARPRRAGPAAVGWRTSSRTTGGWRSCTACSATTGADALPGRRFGSAEALALYRLNALDACVKGALEHGLP